MPSPTDELRHPAAVTTSPPEADLSAPVCEFCSYRLTGLTDDDNCPECGQPVRLSTVDSGRVFTSIDRGNDGFWATSLQIWLHPKRFFRRLRAHADPAAMHETASFSNEHIWLAALLGGAAVVGHYILVDPAVGPKPGYWAPFATWVGIMSVPFIAIVSFGMRWLVVQLSVVETRWRGMRLSRSVIRRGIDYHTAHITPVCLMVLLIVAAAHVAFEFGWLDYQYIWHYLIMLSSAIVLGAIWLFYTYWLAMRSMMYANV